MLAFEDGIRLRFAGRSKDQYGAVLPAGGQIRTPWEGFCGKDSVGRVLWEGLRGKDSMGGLYPPAGGGPIQGGDTQTAAAQVTSVDIRGSPPCIGRSDPCTGGHSDCPGA